MVSLFGVVHFTGDSDESPCTDNLFSDRFLLKAGPDKTKPSPMATRASIIIPSAAKSAFCDDVQERASSASAGSADRLSERPARQVRLTVSARVPASEAAGSAICFALPQQPCS
jgi:hypothetical protein